MALSIKEYKQMLANNQIKWDTDALSGTGKAVSDYLSGVEAQSRFEGQKWSRDEFEKQRGQIGDLRGRLRYMQAYANSLKGKDEKRYGEMLDSCRTLSDGLDQAEQWFRDNREGFLRHKQWQAVEETKRAAQLEPMVQEIDAAEKQIDTQNAALYGNGMTGLWGDQAKAPAGLAANAKDKARKTIAEKYGITVEELNSRYARYQKDQQAQQQAAKMNDALAKLRTAGMTHVAEVAAETGVDEKALTDNYKAVRAKEKQEERDSKYGGMGFDELVGSLNNSANMQIVRDVDDTLREMKPDERQTPEQRQAAVFAHIGEKYGKSADEIRQLYAGSKEAQGFTKYASAEISNEERYDLFTRIIDSATAEQLEALQKTLPKAAYFGGLRDRLNDAIEDKQEEQYYLSVKKQFPEAENAVRYVDAQDFRFMDQASEEEKAAYVKTYAQMKQAGVDTEKFAKFENRYKERLKNRVFQTLVEGATKQNVGTAALATALSTPVNMLGSVADVVKFAVTRVKALGGGDDWYDPKGTASYTAQNMRGAVSDMIGDDHKLAQFLYDTGTSMQDTALAIAVNYIPVAGQAISGAMFFSSAGMAAANEVIERGGNMDQATATLIANGAAELAFEEISLDKLLKAKNNVKNLKTLFSNTAKQMFTEGSEELTTTLANTMTDNWINGGNSAFQRSVRSYEAQGYSHDDAQRAAFKDWNVGILTDFLGGALSGAVFGGAAGGKAYLAARKDANVGSLTVKAGDLAAMAGEDTREARETAQEIVKKNGVEAVLEAAGKSENGQTRQTAQHFAELNEQGKLKEADAAALLVRAAKEQVTVNGIDAAARTLGVETLSDFREKQGKAADLYAGFDLAGNKTGSESTGAASSSFGAAHPNGMIAHDLHGKTVTVLGVESSLQEYGGDGSHTVTLRLSDGSFADAAGIELGDTAYERLLQLTPNYDTLGARALLANFDSAQAAGMPIDDYIGAFQALYAQGARGVTFESAQQHPQMQAVIRNMGEQAARAAMEAGTRDGDILSQSQGYIRKRVRVKGKALHESGVSLEHGVQLELSEDARTFLDMVAEKTGKHIVLTNALSDEDRGIYSDNTIYLNANKEEHVMMVTALHEAVHNMKVYAPEDYRTLEKFVFNYLAAQGKDIRKMLDSIAAVYGKDAATEQTREEELVCKTVEGLAADRDALATALGVKENIPLKEKIGDILKRIADRVMAFFKGDKALQQAAHNRYAHVFLEDVQALREMADIVSRGFDNARETEREFGKAQSAERFAKVDIDSGNTNELTGPKSKDDTIRDTDYLSAVERGDMETAQRMVDEAAEAAGATVLKHGKPKPYYHGRNADFNIFDINRSKMGNQGFGFYFAAVKRFADEYGSTVKNYLLTDKFATNQDHQITAEQIRRLEYDLDVDLSKLYSENEGIDNWIKERNDLAIIKDIQKYIHSWVDVTPAKILREMQFVFGYDGVRHNYETVVWDNSLIKSADPVTYDDNGKVIPLSKRFDKSNPDIRYSKDDTIIDDEDDGQLIFTEDGDISFDVPGKESVIDVERLMQEQGADQAIYTLFNATVRTAEKAIKGYRGVKMDDKSYAAIAKKVMRRFDISEKHAPGIETVIADRIRAYTEAVTQGKRADFSTFINGLATDCKRYLEHSGRYTRGAYEEDAKKLYAILRGATILISPYDESAVLDDYDGNIRRLRDSFKGYVHVGFERERYRYKKPIHIRDVVESFAAETGGNERSPYFPEGADGTAMDGWEAWNWLGNMLEMFKPQFVNSYTGGAFYQSIDAAAVDMALDINAAIADEKAVQAAAMRQADRQAVKEIAEDRRQTLDRQRALHKAQQLAMEQKYARLKQRYEREHGLRELEEENKDILKALAASDRKNFRQQYVERQRKAQYLKQLGRKLGSLTKRLDGKANRNEYIPETLKQPLLSVLQLFDARNDGGNIPGYFGAFRNLDEVGARVEHLARVYSKLEGSKEEGKVYKNLGFDINSAAFNSGVLTDLEYLADTIKGKNVYQMTADDLEMTVAVLNDLDNQLKQCVEMIVDGKREQIQEFAGKGIAQTKHVRYHADSKHLLINAVRSLRNKMITTSLDPVRFGRLLSGYRDDGVWSTLMSDLHRGEQHKILIMQRAYSRLQDDVIAKYDRKELVHVQRKAVEQFTMKDIDTGADVKLSQDMLLSVYLTDRQADGHRHLYNEKFNRYTRLPDLDYLNKNRVLPDVTGNKTKATGEKSHRVRFTKENLEDIRRYVESTPLLKELADGINEVFNGLIAEEINKVSLQQQGRMIATVQDYFPIRVDSDDPGKKFETNTEGEGIFTDERLKSRSFTKQRIRSETAVVITGALDVFQQHVNDAAEWCGMTVPVENIKKVLNSDDGNMTVRKALEVKFGHDALHYMDKLLGDIQKKKDHTDENLFTKATGRAMGAALAVNPRSTLKNWAALPLANRYFGFHHVTAATFKGLAGGKKIVEKYQAYTPYMWYRAQGNGTVVGELSRQHGLYGRWNDKLDIMSWADQRVVNSLLYAAEAHVKQTTDLEYDSEEFKQEVARQFEKCVDESQPNSMITSKPQFVRNDIMRALGLNAFASQRMAMGNSLMDSFMEYSTRLQEYRADKNAESRQAKNDAKKKLLRTMLGVMESGILQTVLGVLATVLVYHKWDDYKDEDGNVTWGSFWSHAGIEMLKGLPEEIAGGFAWLDKLYGAAEKLWDKDSFGADFGNMSVNKLGEIINAVYSGDWTKAWGNFADLTGMPLFGGTNMQRLFQSVVSYAKDGVFGKLGFMDNKGKVDLTYMDVQIAEAYREGNGEQATWLRTMWENELEKQGRVKNPVEHIDKKLVQALANGHDDIKRAYQAKDSGDLKTYKAVKDKYLGMGLSETVFDKAIHKIENAAKKEEKQQTGSEGTAKKREYTYQNAFDALQSGDTESYAIAKKSIAETMVQNGKAKDEKEAGDKVDKDLRSLKYTKALFEAEDKAYHNDDGDGLRRVQKSLLLVYGDRTALNEARKRFKKSKQKKSG